MEHPWFNAFVGIAALAMITHFTLWGNIALYDILIHTIVSVRWVSILICIATAIFAATALWDFARMSEMTRKMSRKVG